MHALNDVVSVATWAFCSVCGCTRHANSSERVGLISSVSIDFDSQLPTQSLQLEELTRTALLGTAHLPNGSGRYSCVTAAASLRILCIRLLVCLDALFAVRPGTSAVPALNVTFGCCNWKGREKIANAPPYVL